MAAVLFGGVRRPPPPSASAVAPLPADGRRARRRRKRPAAPSSPRAHPMRPIHGPTVLNCASAPPRQRVGHGVGGRFKGCNNQWLAVALSPVAWLRTLKTLSPNAASAPLAPPRRPCIPKTPDTNPESAASPGGSLCEADVGRSNARLSARVVARTAKTDARQC